MALRQAFTDERAKKRKAFSLIEIIVASAIFLVAIASISVFLDTSSYHRASFQHELQSMITLLQTARADAMNNRRESSYGVAFFPQDHPNAYVLYRGNNYHDRFIDEDLIIDAAYPISIKNAPIDLTFSELSGDLSLSDDIVLHDNARDADIAIHLNSEGRIDW